MHGSTVTKAIASYLSFYITEVPMLEFEFQGQEPQI